MSLIRNQAAADAIAAALAEGPHHPGNPDTKQPAAHLIIPMFRLHGKPPPYLDAAKATNQTIAEAIVYLIEDRRQLDSTIIANAELRELRQQLADAEAANKEGT